ncbi:MAG: SLC13 family permease [Alphaproteobacteria bacterium]
MAEAPLAPRAPYQIVGLFAGPFAALAILALVPGEALPWPATATAAVAVLMALWWATEAIPVPVTALLPLVLLPLLQVAPFREAATPYAHPIVYLFLGGFITAMAVERSGLHRRMALAIFAGVGAHARAIIGGFMATAALISMWMSNSSTTLMLLPIALSVVSVVTETVPGLSDRDRRNFGTVVLLGLAYGATIGGMSTLVGTPPNAFLSGFMAETYGIDIDFGRWMMVGLPVTVIMLPLAWLLLTRVLYPVAFAATPETTRHLRGMRSELGAMTPAEIRTAVVFLTLIACWMFRRQLQTLPGLDMLNDSVIAMAAAVSLFLIPAGGGQAGPLLRWSDLDRLPWGVLILFGGGLSLAAAVSGSGLAAWLGQQLSGLGAINLVVLILCATALVIFLTELTSNLATAATFLPVMGAIATETGQAPLVFIVPVALAASCAFMLPVATPPNAIVFSSGHVTIPQMVRAGFILNLIGVILLSVVATVLAPAVF